MLTGDVKQFKGYRIVCFESMHSHVGYCDGFRLPISELKSMEKFCKEERQVLNGSFWPLYLEHLI